MKKTTFFGLTAAAILGATVSLLAQEPQEASAPLDEVAIERMSPGPMHAKLAPLVGSWAMTGKWRTTPDAPWQEFEAEVEREWIMDGRFIHETVESEFMGEPFQGLGIVGYDNVRGHYTMVWIDTMGTGTSLSTGKLEGSKIVFEGKNSDAMTGEKDRWSKSSLDIANPDRQVYKGWCKSESGQEFQGMEMIATRK